MQRAITSQLDAYRTPLISMAVLVGFTLALFGVQRVGMPIWTLMIPVIGAAYLLITLQKPMIGLVAVICVFFVPIRLDIGVSLLQTVGGGTAALLMVWFLYTKRGLVFGKIQAPLLLLGVMILVSIWFSMDATRTTFYFRRWVFNMMFVMLMLNLVTTFDVFKKIIWSVMIMAAVNSIAGVIGYASASEHNYRSTGLMENANSFGHLAALAFPLALYQYIYRRGWMRVAGFALLIILTGGIVASVSRGALLSVMVVFAVTLWRERQRAIPLLIVVAVAVAATPLLPEYYQDRVGNLAVDIKNSVMVNNDRGLTSRGYLNSAGLKIWSTHPILGVGIGNFGYYYVQREFVEDLAGSEQTIAHNIYIQALAEMGVVGAFLLLWIMLQSAKSILRARKLSEAYQDRLVYFRAIEMMALAILVSTATYGSLMNNDFWMFIGLTAIASRVAADQPEPMAKPA